MRWCAYQYHSRTKQWEGEGEGGETEVAPKYSHRPQMVSSYPFTALNMLS